MRYLLSLTVDRAMISLNSNRIVVAYAGIAICVAMLGRGTLYPHLRGHTGGPVALIRAKSL